jgi:O-antigen/teichoic acid export membrane protein
VNQLGVEAYALIGFFAVLQGWMALLDFGMTPTMNREMARATAGAYSANSIGDLVRSIEVVCFSLAILVTAAMWLASGWIAATWFSPQALSSASIAEAVAVMAVVIGLRFCEGIYRGALFGMERQLWYNSVNAALSTIRYVGAAVIVLWISPSVQVFFWWQALVSMATVGIFAMATHRWMPTTNRPAQFSFQTLKSITAFAGGISLATLLGLMLTHLDKIMLARLLSLETFGHYMLAVAIAGMFSMLVWPVATAFYPSLVAAAATGNERESARCYGIASQLAAVVIAPAVAVCIFFANEIIWAWTGNSDLASEVGPLLRLLGIGMACNALLQIPFGLQLAHGWTSLSVKVNVLAVIFLLMGEYLAVQYFGAIGAAAIWAGANLLILPAVVVIMHRRLLPNEAKRWFWYGITVPVFLSLAVAGLLNIIMGAASTRPMSVAMIVIAGTAAFLVVAIGLPETRKRLLEACSAFPDGLKFHLNTLRSTFTVGRRKP